MIRFAENKNISFLWERLKNGDQDSLSSIFKYYYDDLYLFGIKMMNQPDLVKDSIQDVFVRIWERRSTLGDVKSPKAYLIAAVRRKLLLNKEQFNQEVNHRDGLFDYASNFSFSISEFKENEEISKQLKTLFHEAINALPERQRELIFLRFYYNLKYTEIAVIMEVNEQSIKNLMQRALSNLREKISSQLWNEIDDMDELLMVLFIFFKKKSNLPST